MRIESVPGVMMGLNALTWMERKPLGIEGFGRVQSA